MEPKDAKEFIAAMEASKHAKPIPKKERKHG